MNTKTFLVEGEGKAAAVALTLLKQSQWYALMPYPDDFWQFTVKEEFHLDLDLEKDIPFPLTAVPISDDRGSVMRIALVACYRSDEAVEDLAEHLCHKVDLIDPDYCRTECDVERLLYEMNDMPEPHIRVEYQEEYAGGNFSGAGKYAYISAVDVDPSDSNEVYEAFEALTELSRNRIVHYSESEFYTKDGERIEDLL